MSTLPFSASRVRNTGDAPHVKRTMSPVDVVLPFVRALILVAIATALIMFGLPAVLAVASAATL